MVFDQRERLRRASNIANRLQSHRQKSYGFHRRVSELARIHQRRQHHQIIRIRNRLRHDIADPLLHQSAFWLLCGALRLVRSREGARAPGSRVRCQRSIHSVSRRVQCFQHLCHPICYHAFLDKLAYKLHHRIIHGKTQIVGFATRPHARSFSCFG